MSTRIVIVTYVNPGYGGDKKPDTCTGCVMHVRKQGSCRIFGPLQLSEGTKSTYVRHANCERAEDRANQNRHTSNTIMLKDDLRDY